MKYQVLHHALTIYVSVVVLSKSAVKPIYQVFRVLYLLFVFCFWNLNICVLPLHWLAVRYSMLDLLCTFFGEHRYYKHMEFLRELSIGYCCILNKALCNRIHNKLHNVWNIPLSHTNFLFCILPQSSSLFRTDVLPKQPSC